MGSQQTLVSCPLTLIRDGPAEVSMSERTGMRIIFPMYSRWRNDCFKSELLIGL